MALHTDLSIYKLCYDLLKLTATLTRNMPKDWKTSYGTMMRNECLSMLLLIAKANAAKDKVPHIAALLEHQLVISLLFQLANDMRFISPKQYAETVVLTGRIGAQAGGWKRQQEEQAMARTSHAAAPAARGSRPSRPSAS